MSEVPPSGEIGTQRFILECGASQAVGDSDFFGEIPTGERLAQVRQWRPWRFFGVLIGGRRAKKVNRECRVQRGFTGVRGPAIAA
jgi:hypothetical protein